ncbi:hypothetical protein KOW79_019570 [Hemibagrus wyckioides]|uniref:Uncharacterized protein n=1 Tax=Hemibagrus wyckioides TaxID=337641 RepID=A0A9D3SAY0_9TELE|nr:hypothetical protein KOW79_019570 [Hemibagrus wyckioides]
MNSQPTTSSNGNAVTSDDVQIPEEAAVEPKSANDVLVTTCCIINQQAKRKHSGDGADLNPKPAESPVQIGKALQLRALYVVEKHRVTLVPTSMLVMKGSAHFQAFHPLSQQNISVRVESQMMLESLKLSKLLLLLRERQMVLFGAKQGGPGRRGSLDLVHRSTLKLCAKGHCITPTLHSTSTPPCDLHLGRL